MAPTPTFKQFSDTLENHEQYTVLMSKDEQIFFIHHDSRHPSVYLHGIYNENNILKLEKYKTGFTNKTFKLFYKLVIKYNYEILFYTKKEWSDVVNLNNINTYKYTKNTKPISPPDDFFNIDCNLFLKQFEYEYNNKYKTNNPSNIIINLMNRQKKWLIPICSNYSILTFSEDIIENKQYKILYKPNYETNLNEKYNMNFYNCDILYL